MTDQTTNRAEESHLPPSEQVIREFNDRGTLWLLEDPANLRDLVQVLEPTLAAQLDITRAERINRSFIPADLQKEESDIIFRVPFQSGTEQHSMEVLIYLLLEHQSKHDPLMGLRLYLYMGHLWDSQRREWLDVGMPASELRLTPVLPIVFYTGRDAWTTPLGLNSLMAIPQELQDIVPHWRTLFLNLQGTPPEALTRFSTAVGYTLRVLQVEREPLTVMERVLNEALIGLEGLSSQQSAQWLRAAWYLVLLVYHRRPRPEYNELVQLIRERTALSKFHHRQQEVENMVQSMAQSMAEEARARAEEAQARGEALGEARGEARGRLTEARALLVRIGTARFGAPDLTITTRIEAIHSLEDLERMADRLLQVENWQELLSPLIA
jgi:hypothetical protein